MKWSYPSPQKDRMTEALALCLCSVLSHLLHYTRKKAAAAGHAPDPCRAAASIAQAVVVSNYRATCLKTSCILQLFTTSSHMGENLPDAGATVLRFAILVPVIKEGKNSTVFVLICLIYSHCKLPYLLCHCDSRYGLFALKRNFRINIFQVHFPSLPWLQFS